MDQVNEKEIYLEQVKSINGKEIYLEQVKSINGKEIYLKEDWANFNSTHHQCHCT